MKGFLRQKENGWFVEWSNEIEHKQPLHSLPLQPDDTINNFELCEGKEVDFDTKEIISDRKSKSNAATFASSINTQSQ
jgi:hypothetical protein